MKTTTFPSRCLSSPAAGKRAGPGQRPSHTPARHLVGAAPRPAAGPDELMYFEELDPAPGREAGPATCPRVLHIDADAAAVKVLAALVAPEAAVTHAGTLERARQLLAGGVYSLVVLDPALPDGDARTLLPLLDGTPLLVYSAIQPDWRGASPVWLAKPWTPARQLWATISGLLGIPSILVAGD